MNRKEPFITNEIYHIYNRGVDGRKVFNNASDLDRFMKSLVVMNSQNPIRHISEVAENRESPEGLVEILGYCVFNNHFHFLLLQKVDGGISEYMKRLLGGYTRYFNTKYKRTGSLFQGKFKSKRLDSDEYSVMIAGYVHANYIIHPNKKWDYIGKPDYVISGLKEKTSQNPYDLNTNKYNPLEIQSLKFTSWCENSARHIYEYRKNEKKQATKVTLE